MDEPNPVKDILYDYLKKFEEEKIVTKISTGDSPKLIEDIISHCNPKIHKLLGDFNENIITLATSLLHYLLTEALIPSQRKVTFGGIELDIVIPDLRTLASNPKKALVISLISSKTNLKKIDEMLKIQPNKENVWLVLPENYDSPQKTFVIGNPSFSSILVKIMEFVDSTNKRHFKIFKN